MECKGKKKVCRSEAEKKKETSNAIPFHYYPNNETCTIISRSSPSSKGQLPYKAVICNQLITTDQSSKHV